MRSRSGSFGSSDNEIFDEKASRRSNGSTSPHAFDTFSPTNPGTPRGYMSGYISTNNTSSNNAYTEFTGGDDWIEVSRDQIYLPGPDDVGKKLKIEAAAYSLETGELLMSRVVKTDVILGRAPDPLKRNLVTSKSGGGSGPRFRVVTYNVLAEIYATQQQYPYCDFWALSWDYRFQNILREIVDASPEVVCLQEIQADHYENHVYAAMSDAGFEGVYKQKTRQSMGLAGKVDGCALFWRRSKFHLVESYSIEFNEVAQRQATQVLGYNPRSDEGVAFLNRLSKDNVAQLVVLEFIQQQSRSNREINQVCIANTHLYSNKDFPDVKLWQTWQLLQELESFVVSRGTNLPLIICGDFNSTPDTAVYDLLSRQSVHPGHPDVNVATGDDVPNVLPDASQITHSFQLGSAYQTVLGEEPWVTNFTANFKGVLDYIWYSAQNLRPLSAAPIPDESQLTHHGEALPSTAFSSDHIMLISDMQIFSTGAR
jgi:CCR4-NOT transcription complex subunit 6